MERYSSHRKEIPVNNEEMITGFCLDQIRTAQKWFNTAAVTLLLLFLATGRTVVFQLKEIPFLNVTSDSPVNVTAAGLILVFGCGVCACINLLRALSFFKKIENNGIKSTMVQVPVLIMGNLLVKGVIAFILFELIGAIFLDGIAVKGMRFFIRTVLIWSPFAAALVLAHKIRI